MKKIETKNSILATLKMQTREQHEQIEAHLDLLNRAATIESYRELLARFYGFYAPLERQVLAAINNYEIGFDFAPRRKTPLLQTDLNALGVGAAEIERLPVCRNLPIVNTPAHFFGYLYVAEGSTLGGQIISRHFAQTLGIAGNSGGAFFSAYGAETGTMWRGFQTAAETFAENDERHDEIIRTAIETFETLDAWMNVRL